jgi:hypothetical protein
MNSCLLKWKELFGKIHNKLSNMFNTDSSSNFEWNEQLLLDSNYPYELEDQLKNEDKKLSIKFAPLYASWSDCSVFLD